MNQVNARKSLLSRMYAPSLNKLKKKNLKKVIVVVKKMPIFPIMFDNLMK